MDDKNIKKIVDEFLNDGENSKENTSVIKSDKSIVERVDKKIITEDGRQLLF